MKAIDVRPARPLRLGSLSASGPLVGPVTVDGETVEVSIYLVLAPVPRWRIGMHSLTWPGESAVVETQVDDPLTTLRLALHAFSGSLRQRRMLARIKDPDPPYLPDAEWMKLGRRCADLDPAIRREIARAIAAVMRRLESDPTRQK